MIFSGFGSDSFAYNVAIWSKEGQKTARSRVLLGDRRRRGARHSTYASLSCTLRSSRPYGFDWKITLSRNTMSLARCSSAHASSSKSTTTATCANASTKARITPFSMPRHPLRREEVLRVPTLIRFTACRRIRGSIKRRRGRCRSCRGGRIVSNFFFLDKDTWW